MTVRQTRRPTESFPRIFSRPPTPPPPLHLPPALTETAAAAALIPKRSSLLYWRVRNISSSSGNTSVGHETSLRFYECFQNHKSPRGFQTPTGRLRRMIYHCVPRKMIPSDKLLNNIALKSARQPLFKAKPIKLFPSTIQYAAEP